MITPRAASIYGHLTALAEPTRSRILLLLDRHELTVSELGSVLQLPQSTTSRHLRILSDEGWLVARAEGTSRRYRLAASRLDEPARHLWGLVRAEVASTPPAAQDSRRLDAVLAQRRSRQAAWFDSAAESWDRTRSELIGERTDLLAMLALIDPSFTVGDLGSGVGHVSEALAPCVERVIAVDESGPMLEAARRRLTGLPSVELRAGSLEALPVADEELDAAVMMLVAHYLADPARAIAEAGRALRGGARFVLVDFLPHDREADGEQPEHMWPGFEEGTIARWLDAGGFLDVRFRPLPADPHAKGPGLFVASATRAG